VSAGGAVRTVCWRRHDHPGHEVCALSARPEGGWRLSGTAVLAMEGLPCAVTFSVDLDEAWRTRGAWVAGGVGGRRVEAVVLRDAEGRWTLNGNEVEEVRGCVDVDLAFSPSTNLLPVRRLALAPGSAADVRAAWLRFPQLTLEPLEQRYTRTGEAEYRYQSRGDAFTALLTVDEHGLVVRYGDIWSTEARA
jgi:hypothetical protein